MVFPMAPQVSVSALDFPARIRLPIFPFSLPIWFPIRFSQPRLCVSFRLIWPAVRAPTCVTRGRSSRTQCSLLGAQFLVVRTQTLVATRDGWSGSDVSTQGTCHTSKFSFQNVNHFPREIQNFHMISFIKMNLFVCKISS
jgi:hypothetical protein